MESEDDIQPLIPNDVEETRDLYLELTAQYINSDPDFEQVVYGYKTSRWRRTLVHIFCAVLCGIPLLVFHWLPRWFLYATCVRCCFQVADRILVIETYQKKCKSFYIHKILEKDIADTSGLLNEAFQDDFNEKDSIENIDTIQTPLHFDDGTTLASQQYRYIRHKKQTLIFEPSRAQWLRLAGVEAGATCAQLHQMGANNPSSERRVRMLNIYGLNEIKVPMQGVMTLVLLEVFNPFYVFQLFTIGVWLAERYYYYCIAIVIMSTFGVATSVIQTKRNQQQLRATVEAIDTVELSDGRTVDSRCVSPGDVVCLPQRGCVLHFDGALLAGTAVVNESMLTGESVPVTKTALLRVDKRFDMKEHSSSVLFCGTRVTQTRYYNNEPVRVLVLRTGYNTSKGQLVRSILYPVPADFKFDRDSYKFIIILGIIAVIGFSYTIGLKTYRSLTPGDIALKALDIITIVIPPALPAAMTVGRLYAVARLKRARVSCLNTRAVNVSGSVDCFAFDKTGTLTEDGLDMWGVVPVSAATSPPLMGAPVRDPRHLNDLHELKLGMATCHSLTRVDDQLCGDPLDVIMFESTGWTLEEPDVPDPTKYEILMPTIVRPKKTANINVDDVHMPLELGVIQQHQFVSSLQRACVVTRMLGETVARVYCKGAPETVVTLCDPSTVPANLNEVLSSYAEKGYRVIALTTRMLEATIKQIQTMTRDQLECELEFLGLVIMENRLKPATTAVIAELKQADVHIVMITGDNIHTAVSVAKECGILQPQERVVALTAQYTAARPVVYCDSTLNGVAIGRRTELQNVTTDWCEVQRADVESPSCAARYKLVMTGDVWRILRDHYPDTIPRLVSRGAVFARMTPDQKQQLIGEYQALGYYVGMCGDGANDCGALRAAHTGVSLSELESSVAAPFTCSQPDIACTTRLLREGRAALTTSFGVFKFMVAYSLTEFFSVAFLYYFDTNLTDFQFLFIDVALILNFAFFFGMTEAYSGRLSKLPPLTSLLGIVPLFSLVGQMVFVAAGQFLCYYALTMFPWYVRNTYQGREEYACWENYAIYCVSMFQYIILAVVFSHGSPYRKSLITNKLLVMSMLIMTAICAYITIAPAEWLAGFLELKLPEDVLLAYVILLVAIANLIVALFFERVIVQYCMEIKQIVPRYIKEKKVRKTPHLSLKRLLTDDDYLGGDSVVKDDTEGNSVALR